jgi:hypothetical protein
MVPRCGVIAWWRQRQGAKLLEEAEVVHQEPAVLPFAVDNAVDDNPLHGYVSSGCWDSHEGGSVRSVHGEPGHDFVTLANLLLRYPTLVREGRKQHGRQERFQTLAAGRLSGQGVEFDVVFDSDFVDGGGADREVLVAGRD